MIKFLVLCLQPNYHRIRETIIQPFHIFIQITHFIFLKLLLLETLPDPKIYLLLIHFQYKKLSLGILTLRINTYMECLLFQSITPFIGNLLYLIWISRNYNIFTILLYIKLIHNVHLHLAILNKSQSCLLQQEPPYLHQCHYPLLQPI